ncbi:formate dehydrogenase related protein, partial [mine drainage metagenome]
WVRVRSELGAVKARAHRSSRVTGKTLYLAIHGRAEAAVNRLTNAAQDPSTRTPAYKEVPVALERLSSGAAGSSPLRSTNPRLHRTVPQTGIRVEERRARPEYAPIAR